jgi:alanine dehydrogenase
MHIGLPTEIKNHEYRVGLTPASVRELCSHGHSVLVQSGAGQAIGLSDALYQAAGATLVPDAASVFAQADMVVKVKEPQPQECAMLRHGQILYTYLHLAPDLAQTAALVQSGAVCIAYETITGANGGLRLQHPHRVAGQGQTARHGQADHARADDDGVHFFNTWAGRVHRPIVHNGPLASHF